MSANLSERERVNNKYSHITSSPLAYQLAINAISNGRTLTYTYMYKMYKDMYTKCTKTYEQKDGRTDKVKSEEDAAYLCVEAISSKLRR